MGLDVARPEQRGLARFSLRISIVTHIYPKRRRRRANDCTQIGQFGNEAQGLSRERSLGENDRRITGPTRFYSERNPAPHTALNRVNHLFDRRTTPCPEVDPEDARSGQKSLQGEHVSAGEIAHMNKVSHTRAVWRRVIVAVDFEALEAPCRSEQCAGY